jgi:hypothetical protein
VTVSRRAWHARFEETGHEATRCARSGQRQKETTLLLHFPLPLVPRRHLRARKLQKLEVDSRPVKSKMGKFQQNSDSPHPASAAAGHIIMKSKRKRICLPGAQTTSTTLHPSRPRPTLVSKQAHTARVHARGSPGNRGKAVQTTSPSEAYRRLPSTEVAAAPFLAPAPTPAPTPAPAVRQRW